MTRVYKRTDNRTYEYVQSVGGKLTTTARTVVAADGKTRTNSTTGKDGEKFLAMLREGQSQPWQDTFEKLTGTRETSATAIIEHFQPLLAWLETQNAGRKCGWE